VSTHSQKGAALSKYHKIEAATLCGGGRLLLRREINPTSRANYGL
jgi:hypothetical protein